MFIVVWMEACRASVPAEPSSESGLVQPRTVSVAERVPADLSELPGCNLTCVVDQNALAVAVGSPYQHHTPAAAPHVGHTRPRSIPKGEDASSGSRSGGTVGSSLG